MLLAYETGVVATLPALTWCNLQGSNLVPSLFRRPQRPRLLRLLKCIYRRNGVLDYFRTCTNRINTYMLTCNHCNLLFKPTRTNNKNPQKFCSNECARADKKKTEYNCISCNKITTNPKFCCNSCAATFNNSNRAENGYVVTNEHKLKISNATKGIYRGKIVQPKQLDWTTPTGSKIVYEVCGPFTKLHLCKCKFTNTYFVSRTVKTILPDLARTKKEYEYSCRFSFGISSYPEWFTDASLLINKYGWYSAPGSNKKGISNVNGISRDHMLSVSYGFKNNIHPLIVSHPANCTLLQHKNNQQKHDTCSITLDELLNRIEKFNIVYPARPFGFEPKLLVLETRVPPTTLRACTIH